jgi:hypothetical protein
MLIVCEAECGFRCDAGVNPKVFFSDRDASRYERGSVIVSIKDTRAT